MTEKQSGMDRDSNRRNKQLERSLQYITREYVMRTREISLIRRIGEALINAEDQRIVCLSILNIIVEEITAENCKLLFFQEGDLSVVLKAEQNQYDDAGVYYDHDSIVCKDIEQSIVYPAIRNSETLYLKNTKDFFISSDDPLINSSATSLLCIPLTASNVNIGLILLDAPEVDAFAEEDRRILQIVANQIAIVLMNVKLIKRLKQANKNKSKLLKQLSEAEKELSEYSTNLEEQIKKRTQDLIQSEKLAAIGQLISGVAHELNNPLSIINGYIELLTTEYNLDSNVIETIDKLKIANERCLGISKNLLRLSRIGKKFEEVTDINNLLKDTLNLYELKLRKSNIKLITEFNDSIPKTLVDAQQIQQVFLNVISNSCHALNMAADNRELKIITDSNEDNIVIEFTDSGPGVPENYRNRIFDPFFTTKTNGHGTGLGLSLSKELISGHEGTILLDERNKEGAKFVIQLPVASPEAIDAAASASTSEQLSESTRILLIDEDTEIIAFQKKLLSRYTENVDHSYSCNDALDFAKERKYDLVIIDLNISGDISGETLAILLMKSSPELKNRIIFTADEINDYTINDQSLINECGIIRKPFKIDTYIACLDKCLQTSNQ